MNRINLIVKSKHDSFQSFKTSKINSSLKQKKDRLWVKRIKESFFNADEYNLVNEFVFCSNTERKYKLSLFIYKNIIFTPASLLEKLLYFHHSYRVEGSTVEILIKYFQCNDIFMSTSFYKIVISILNKIIDWQTNPVSYPILLNKILHPFLVLWMKNQFFQNEWLMKNFMKRFKERIGSTPTTNYHNSFRKLGIQCLLLNLSVQFLEKIPTDEEKIDINHKLYECIKDESPNFVCFFNIHFMCFIGTIF